MNDDQTWIDHYRSHGVLLSETDYGDGPVFILSDDQVRQYLIKIWPSRPGEGDRRLNVSVSLEWSGERPGELANYTLQPEHSRLDCAPEELTISDDGLLSMMARQNTSPNMLYRWGWTLQLPTPCVKPARQAIALAIAALPK
ncbi:hypothetical protein M0L66_007486 [Pseudomonas aeruginosa]|uniref:hypothetical protein n=1 Tax=Pseudomonas aeruginosa TaxID=287 RepID=UPI00053E8BC0|nr:hypothetical protein [Pseudomonas aeruginosa]EKV0214956.1 hypothetical protein [Pseudomonas aeruginosa]EKV0215460.1 hypothetical protein [Pseudomonas aeruginosa]EKV4188132.1 hypothetical protein [Pseudomonas aeruginosa]EKV4188420.1 hypothetical protein [Pseudomonas aeruginosa]EKX5071428.1 hypothetical protein [Pseudomonas aeruginosa]